MVSQNARIIFSFDDGNIDVYNNAYPIMKKFNCSGVFYIPTALIGNSGYVTYSQLQEMQSDGWEIGSHSTDSTDLTSISLSEAENKLINSKNILENNGLNIYGFAPPSRRWNNDLANLAKENNNYFYIRAGNGGNDVNIKYPINNLYYIKNITTSFDSQNDNFVDAKNWIDKAVDNNSIVVFLFHHIRDVEDNYSTNLSDFEKIVRYGKYKENTTNAKITTMIEAIEDLGLNFKEPIKFIKQ
jgi:peptidoglycan/xylan/chitin deacetylase (PgdA/CDA1 family)